MNVINNQCLIATISTNTLQLAKQYEEDRVLYIPMQLKGVETSLAKSALELELCDENEIDIFELVENDKSKFEYNLSCDLTNTTPKFFVSVSNDDYASAFLVELDEKEKSELLWQLLLCSKFDTVENGGEGELLEKCRADFRISTESNLDNLNLTQDKLNKCELHDYVKNGVYTAMLRYRDKYIIGAHIDNIYDDNCAVVYTLV